jgi:cyclase
MLKRRIIPLILWQDGRLVKTRQFENPVVVGDLIKACKVYSDQDADELIILNINEGGSSFVEFLSSIEKLSREVMMPIAVGGGIYSLDSAERAFRSGADKVVVNSAHYDNPELLGQISSRFGAQAVIVSLDYRVGPEGTTFWAKGGGVRKNIEIESHLKSLSAQGFGELMIQAIDRDGMKVGYDLTYLAHILRQVNMPVIVAGGAGNFEHLHDAFELGVDAVACGTIFNFGDNNPQRAKAFLRNYGVPLKKSL